MRDLTGALWSTSTRSGNTACVEVATALEGVVGLRDSKDRSGPALAFSPAAWAAFAEDVKAGTFDRS